MKKKYVAKHMWTKDEIKKLVSLWEDCTKEEVADELNMSITQLSSMVRRIRLAGYHLTKKSNRGDIHLLIDEAFGDLGLSKSK
jgi:biotin operon repressor